MRIPFLGAADMLTGSQYLTEANGLRLLLECGSFHGKRDDSMTWNRTIAYDPRA
jgi:hypothetical protein